jgi:putative DNA methylase
MSRQSSCGKIKVTDRRLIEVAFPLKQASLDSVHEKNVRHGHISTLHIWPARRPLAACRAALIATLLPDPGTPEARRELCERIGGKVIKQIEKKKGPGAKGEEKLVEKTVGGILHWGRETENKADIEFFRQEIRKAFGGRAPRVLDPFAGGGAIPLEAMRLGCEVTAIDINPVAWFILKCTLEYPQKLAGQKRPLPEFVRTDALFMESFFKAQGFKGTMLRSQLRKMGIDQDRQLRSRQDSLVDRQTGKEIDLPIEEHTLEADLAWHVRAWGWWVLREARRELARYYPTYADFQPLKDVNDWRRRRGDQAQPITSVPLLEDGTADVDALNAEFSEEYLTDGRNPRWVAKPTVAYLWARTVKCKNCRATIPLLKTCWLAKKEAKRVLLRMEPNADRSGMAFAIESDVPVAGGNNAQRRENDRRLGQGTMSRAGAWCPCCGKPGTVAMESGDIRAEASAGRMSATITAVVIDSAVGKEYRLPSRLEVECSSVPEDTLQAVFATVPLGIPDEPVPEGGSRQGGGSPFTVHLYGMRSWRDLYTNRQLATMGTLVRLVRETSDRMLKAGYDEDTVQAMSAFLAIVVDRVADYSSASCSWHNSGEKMGHTFARFALPILWDYAEAAVLGDASGSYSGALDWVGRYIPHATQATTGMPAPTIASQSAIQQSTRNIDLVLTDPPYYDAIPYADLMDFFYVWLRRCLWNRSDLLTKAFSSPLSPKWSHEAADGELTDDPSRHGGDSGKSKLVYEDGMFRAFSRCVDSLADGGRLVVVFANKQPDAWETLVSALIRAGLVVDGSWPIQTEMGQRTRALASAALASSVWLACRKRDALARPGWDNVVLEEMRRGIAESLREFWDAGIRGPDFVWAATGPALEAYSKHPVVKKANDPGQTMSVSEFLRAVRRLVVEFVVGRVLGELTRAPAVPVSAAPLEGIAGLDDVTTYYLLHRHDFGMNDAPAGACILYALSCNLSEGDLADRYGLLLRTGGVVADEDGEAEEGDADAEGEVNEGSGSTFKLRPWKQRRRAGFGATPANGSLAVPLVDMVHHLMHLWVDGDVHKVNAYIDERGLRRSETFRQVLQALIELAEEGSDERSVLERISNHLQARGHAPATLREVGLGAAGSGEQE